MKFLDDDHKKFYESKLKELNENRKSDVYYKSLIYTLAICNVTREHFADIFNIIKGEINIDSISAAYQTGTSVKMTRLAFNLFNGCNYDSNQDLENDRVSLYYNVNEIFNCSYGPYMYEAICIRYSKYAKKERK